MNLLEALEHIVLLYEQGEDSMSARLNLAYKMYKTAKDATQQGELYV